MSDEQPKEPGYLLSTPWTRGNGAHAAGPGPVHTPMPINWLYASHSLAQSENWQEQLRIWWNAIPVGGSLCLWLPYGNLVSIPNGKFAFTPPIVWDELKKLGGWDCLDDDQKPAADLRYFFIVLRKRGDSQQVYQPWQRKPKSLLIARYGGMGDGLMVASILPWLKEQGWNITLNCTTNIEDVMRHDPHIDGFLSQEVGRIPGGNAAEYIKILGTRFDKTINLLESIEGPLLSLPSRMDYYWPESVRKTICDKNYVEWTHALAEVPFEPGRVRFYPTKTEAETARAWKLARVGNRPLVVWAVSGSAPHKVWPHLGKALVRLKDSGAVYALAVGPDYAAHAKKSLDDVLDYVGTSEHVVSLEGMSARDTMALALQADMVIGPETALTNAVCNEPMPKVVMLSHSSVNMLTRDWVNTVSLRPPGVEPCRFMHYPQNPCPADEKTGMTSCAAKITTEMVVDEVRRLMPKPKPLFNVIDCQAAD